MRRLTLSVGLPNYNHGHLIGRALDAIVGQSLPPDQLVVVDDASTDRSVEVIESYAKRYPYIRFVRNEKNLGAHQSQNQAATISTCDFHYAAAADDLVLPGAFEAAMSMASANPMVGIVFGHQRMVDGDRTWTQKARSWSHSQHVSPTQFLHEYLEVEVPYHHLATLYRREAWEKIGFFRLELESFGDTFATHALGLMHGAAYVNKPLSISHLADDTFSGRARQNPRAMIDLISRCAWLKRSESYRAYFPESYVESWERDFRALVIYRAYRRIKRELRKRLEDPSGRSDPLPLRLITKLAIRIVSRATRRSLIRYPGDLSCYEAEGADTRAGNRTARTP